MLLELEQEIRKAILTTRQSKINAVSKSGSSEESSTLRKVNNDTQSLLFELSQSTDKQYLQQAMNICKTLTLQYTNLFHSGVPLDGIIRIIEKQLDILKKEETVSNSR
ncbi:MAG: hypothetical protein AAHH96_02830 [Candidatus Symbiodolus clandestinus]